MKTITLVRHGKPVIWNQYSPLSMISSERIANVIEEYDHSELINKVDNKNAILDLIKTGDLFLSSDLKRAKKSYELLGISDYKADVLFNEAKLPLQFIKKKIKLPVFIWVFLLRIIWLLGYHNSSCESVTEFSCRMDNAVQYLEDELNNSGHIVIMAHGFVNLFLIRKLLKKGWKKNVNSINKKFWSYSQVILVEPGT